MTTELVKIKKKPLGAEDVYECTGVLGANLYGTVYIFEHKLNKYIAMLK